MLAHKTARIRQLSGGVPTEEPPSSRIDLQPRFRVNTVTKHDKALAESFLKREASAARTSQPLLRRVRSRLTKPDKAVTLKALCNHVYANGSAEVAQIYIDRLCIDAAESALPFELPDSLLLSAIQNSNVDLVRLLAPFTAEEAASAALEPALDGRERRIVTALLEYGADPNKLSHDCICRLAETQLELFRFVLSAPKQLRHDVYGNICVSIIQNGQSSALNVLLRHMSDYQVFSDGPVPWNRDCFLSTAIASPDKTAFFALAAATSNWLLRDNRLFVQTLENPGIDRCLAKDMVEVLLCLSDTMSPSFRSSPELQVTLCRCVQQQQEDMLRLMLSYGVQLSPEPVALAYHNQDYRVLDILLSGNILGADNLVARISRPQGAFQQSLRHKILARLLASGAGGGWMHDELVKAVSEGQVPWVETLIDAGASVDYQNGAALLQAVSLGQVRIARKLLSRPVSLQSLQTSFPSVCQLEALPRRLLTKLFLDQGLTGQCLDEALNVEICNYSNHRDVELINTLLRGGGHFTDLSLTVAFEHRDVSIFDALRLSQASPLDSASQWLRDRHQSLFNHVQQRDDDARVSSACLRMLLSKMGAVGDLCSAHDGQRQLECFHRLLECGAADLELLSSCLRWTQYMDSLTRTELVLTAACFCDLDQLQLIIRTMPPGSSASPLSSTFKQRLAPSPQPDERPNQFSSARLPPLQHDDWEFSDEQTSEAFKIVFRQYFQGLVESQLVTRLLRRHLEQCKEATAPGEDWPILTTQYLLSQPIEVTAPDYISCLQMAIASQQWLVLESLLDRQLPRDMLSSFFLVETSSLAPTAVRVLLESQAMSCVDDDFFPEIVQRAFNYACLSQDQELAVLLCTKSRCKLHITAVLDALMQALDASELEYISTVLGAASFQGQDLDTLWQHSSQQFMGNEFLGALEVLLQAGANGRAVELSLLDAIERNDERLLALILTYLQPPTAHQHQNFDYRGRRLAVCSQPWKLGDDHVFAQALHDAVRLDRGKMCQRLCTAGAPLVYRQQSLVQVAVVLGSHNALVQLIQSTKARPDMDQAINFALLQAVEHSRPSWIPSLVELGGSPEAYEFEPLNSAVRLGRADTLRTLLSYIQTPERLGMVQRQVTGRLSEPGVDLDSLCAMFEHLRQAGFDNPEAFGNALLEVSKLFRATLNNVNTLINCGASVEFSNGGCMVQTWKRGNVKLFPYLLAHCTRDSIVTLIWDEAATDYIREEEDQYALTNESALVVFKALLERDTAQEVLDATLNAIAHNHHHNPRSSAIIELLLEHGARFIDGAGLPFYQICRFGGPKVTALAIKSNPPVRTRFSATLHLFRNQDIDAGLGCTPEYFLNNDNAQNQQCLYNINFPAPEDDFDELDSSDIISLLSAMLSPKGQRVGTNLMFSFFFMRGGLRLLANRSATPEDRNVVNLKLNEAIMEPQDRYLDQRVEFLIRVLQIEPLDSGPDRFALDRGDMTSLLLSSLESKKFSMVDTLLEAGADTNGHGTYSQSALYLATLENALGAMESLIKHGARANDGSLHTATCRQYHEAMHLLLRAGHTVSYCSLHYLDDTPLEAFLRHNHSTEAEDLFGVTLAVLLCDTEIPDDFWTRDPSPLALALAGSSPFEMFSSLLDISPLGSDDIPLIRQDRFMFSILSFVENGADIPITDVQRVELADRLEELEFTRTYYAEEGEHPDEACNIPEHLEAPEIRARRRAWREKECAVCGEKPDDRQDIHAALSPSCEAKHGWDDDIICTDCLQGHLESQMFPQGDDRFPSSKVKCWAANCAEILSHGIIQEFADPDRFAVYDASLAQLCLNDGSNTAKCAMPGCIGATWLDTEEDKDVTIITCPVCSEDTCIQCNQPYDKHRDEPCPQGEEAKGVERRREEEAATAALLAKGKKCPKCQLAYERIEGCDHIVCGKDAHSQGRSRGCGFEFCYLCGANYDLIRQKGNKEHARGCTHYA